MAKTQDNIQIAALPYRTGDDGSLVVTLVTSRETRRWVIPKGWKIKGLTSPEAATQEAYEEAGLVDERGLAEIINQAMLSRV